MLFVYLTEMFMSIWFIKGSSPSPLSIGLYVRVCECSQPGCWGIGSSCRANPITTWWLFVISVQRWHTARLSLQLRYRHWLGVSVNALLPSVVHYAQSRTERPHQKVSPHRCEGSQTWRQKPKTEWKGQDIQSSLNLFKRIIPVDSSLLSQPTT